MTTTATPTTDPDPGEVFRPGELVTCRDREWVVQNGSTDDVLRLKPIAGADDDETIVLRALEDISPATFAPPTLDDLGADADVRLLEQAFRISNQDPAGPFRGFGRIAVRPRPYQLVPLLMALRQLGQPATDGAYEAVRLLVSDDVGVGKTIEALLIANELLTTGEADGLAVVCPPHLADQWVDEMRTKFHLDAVKVVPSTVKKLERDLAAGESLFHRHPVTVVSLDWVKSKRRRDEFAQEAPNCVIVDEAHLCAKADDRTGKHLRHELLTKLSSEQLRHLLLVTATPHSGKESAFLSLIGLLHPLLAEIEPGDEFTGDDRERLARHFVARKRVDVAKYQGDDDQIVFPTRLTPVDEDGNPTTYKWTPTSELSTLIREVIDWARPRLSADNLDARNRRVWWWAILGLGRALGSSPRAAAESLRTRAGLDDVAAGIDDPDAAVAEVDQVGRELVTDPDIDDLDDVDDTTPGAKVSDDPAMQAAFAAFADRVEQLEGVDKDPKAALAAEVAADLLDRGKNPIFFCTFVHTAEYLAEILADKLDSVAVKAVTGNTPADVRAEDVAALGSHDRRVLVATNCLSEGINLQESFDAVLHYDLPWSPTRLEQREGRVDRYGQPSDTVHVSTFEGAEPTLDGFIQTHLIDKHNRIKQRLGFSIPVPGVTDDIIDAAASVWFGNEQPTLFSEQIEQRWEQAVAEQVERVEWAQPEEETKTRAKYAQRTIDPTDVARQAEAVAAEIGTPRDVARFVVAAATRLGATVVGDIDAAADPNSTDTVTVSFPDDSNSHALHTIASTIGLPPDDTRTLDLRFDSPAPRQRTGRVPLLLARTHPVVADLSRLIIDPAMDRHVHDDVPARLGVITTDAVDRQTMLVTCRFRYDLHTRVRRKVRTGPDAGTYATDADTHLVEQVVTVPVTRRPGTTEHTVADDVHPDQISPTNNTPPADRQTAASRAVATIDELGDVLTDRVLTLGEHLEQQHADARGAFSEGGLGSATVDPHPTYDVLSMLVARPDRAGADL